MLEGIAEAPPSPPCAPLASSSLPPPRPRDPKETSRWVSNAVEGITTPDSGSSEAARGRPGAPIALVRPGGPGGRTAPPMAWHNDLFSAPRVLCFSYQTMQSERQQGRQIGQTTGALAAAAGAVADLRPAGERLLVGQRQGRRPQRAGWDAVGYRLLQSHEGRRNLWTRRVPGNNCIVRGFCSLPREQKEYGFKGRGGCRSRNNSRNLLGLNKCVLDSCEDGYGSRDRCCWVYRCDRCTGGRRCVSGLADMSRDCLCHDRFLSSSIFVGLLGGISRRRY